MSTQVSPDSSLPPAVVVGLDCITGLQTARILWRRGVPVVGVASDRSHFAARTRACRTVIHAPTSGDALVSHLEELGRRLGQRAVLFPCTDAAVATIAASREALRRHYHVPLSEDSVVQRLLDKIRFEAWASEHGYPIPRTLPLMSRADALRAGDELRFPAVVKPAVKTPRWLAFTKAKVIEVPDATSLLRAYDTYAPLADGLTAQEWVVGPDSELYSCNAYFDEHSNPLAAFVARKLRQWPPRTGTSSLGEECTNDVVLDTTLRLFREAGFHGLAYLEMKRDVRTGDHYIIEPNVGRPTGRSAIAEAGGVELLMTAYADAAGRELPVERSQLGRGAKWMYFRNDLLSALHAWRHGDLSLGEWRRSLSGPIVDAVWSREDPAPFAADLLGSGMKLGRSMLRAVPRVGGLRRAMTPAAS